MCSQWNEERIFFLCSHRMKRAKPKSLYRPFSFAPKESERFRQGVCVPKKRAWESVKMREIFVFLLLPNTVL